MEKFFEQLNSSLVTILIALLNVGVATALRFVATLGKKATTETDKIKDESLKGVANNAIATINNLVQVNVIRLNETIVTGIKTASEDGKIQKEELLKVAETCKEHVVKQMSQEVYDNAQVLLDDVEDYILGRIEVELAKIKGRV